jgi:hypothetical protein
VTIAALLSMLLLVTTLRMSMPEMMLREKHRAFARA